MKEGTDMSWSELLVTGLVFVAVFGGVAIWSELGFVLPQVDLPELSRPVKVVALILVVFSGIAVGKLIGAGRGQNTP